MAVTVRKQYANQHAFWEITCTTEAMRLTLITIGASIKRLETPDQSGVFENIVMTYARDKDYLTNTKYLGATIGPYAGRIAPPRFTVNAETYHLCETRSDPVNLHSGSDTLALKHFDLIEANEQRAVFSYRSDEEASMFPAPTTYTVTYHFKRKGFTITYSVHSEKDTYVNLTNHSYFNLSGQLRDTILNHTLKLPAQHYMALNEASIGVAQRSVFGTPFDFTTPKPLKQCINALENTPQKGIDHPFFLEEGSIELSDPYSKRTLEITTDYEWVVVYTNNDTTTHRFEGDREDHIHQAICLEMQHLPNDIHSENHARSFLPKGETRIQNIAYRVGTL